MFKKCLLFIFFFIFINIKLVNAEVLEVPNEPVNGSYTYEIKYYWGGDWNKTYTAKLISTQPVFFSIDDYDNIKGLFAECSVSYQYLSYTYPAGKGKLFNLDIGRGDYLISINNIPLEEMLPPQEIPRPQPNISKDDLLNFNFKDDSIYFYTPSNGSIVNLHNDGNPHYYRVKARAYLKMYAGVFHTDSGHIEKVEKMLTVEGYTLENIKATYVEKPKIGNYWISKIYIDFDILVPTISVLGRTTFDLKFYDGAKLHEPFTYDSILVDLVADATLPNGSIGSDGTIEDIPNGGSDSSGQIPNAPSSDSSIGEWFTYISNLVMWIFTYPFKLLSDVFSTLTFYIDNMVSELRETSGAVSGLFTFIPQDILNVTYGIISFTLLYSVVRGVLKLIRG